jgi:hypothetical protein
MLQCPVAPPFLRSGFATARRGGAGDEWVRLECLKVTSVFSWCTTTKVASQNIIYDGLDFCHVSHVIDWTSWCLLKIIIDLLNLWWPATVTDPIPNCSFIWCGSVRHGGLTWQSGWHGNIWCDNVFEYGPILAQWEII